MFIIIISTSLFPVNLLLGTIDLTASNLAVGDCGIFISGKFSNLTSFSNKLETRDLYSGELICSFFFIFIMKFYFLKNKFFKSIEVLDIAGRSSIGRRSRIGRRARRGNNNE